LEALLRPAEAGADICTVGLGQDVVSEKPCRFAVRSSKTSAWHTNSVVYTCPWQPVIWHKHCGWSYSTT
jgi:hypothetical protein